MILTAEYRKSSFIRNKFNNKSNESILKYFNKSFVKKYSFNLLLYNAQYPLNIPCFDQISLGLNKESPVIHSNNMIPNDHISAFFAL